MTLLSTVSSAPITSQDSPAKNQTQSETLDKLKKQNRIREESFDAPKRSSKQRKAANAPLAAALKQWKRNIVQG
jgi:hypothetical protein